MDDWSILHFICILKIKNRRNLGIYERQVFTLGECAGFIRVYSTLFDKEHPLNISITLN